MRKVGFEFFWFFGREFEFSWDMEGNMKYARGKRFYCMKVSVILLFKLWHNDQIPEWQTHGNSKGSHA